MPDAVETREAQWGNGMIELRVRFWTDGLVEGKGHIRPKHAWGAGVVRMSSNKAHGVTPKNPRPFNSMGEMLDVMEQVLTAHGVRLHPHGRTQKLFGAE